MVGKAATLFRVVAVAEALSWLALLVGMFLKHVVRAGDGGVPVIGMAHGVLFLTYVVVTLAVFRVFGWSLGTLALALLAGVPPMFTWLFEGWALRSGKLDGPDAERYGGTGLFLSARSEAAA